MKTKVKKMQKIKKTKYKKNKVLDNYFQVNIRKKKKS